MALPGNSWLIEIADGRVQRQVAGGRVETSADFLAEGAWAGDFSAAGALGSPFRCGSGVIFEDGRLRIFAPSHSLDPVYCFLPASRRAAFVSNSAQMIVAAAPEARPDSLGDARARSNSLKLGAGAYDRIVAATDRGAFFRMAWTTFTLDLRTMRLSEDVLLSPGVAPFSDYQSFRATLLETMRAVVTNARDPARASPYGPIVATCSSGYDSAAVAVLARDLGAELAVTLATGRGGDDDSGVPIATALGLRCVEYPRFGAGMETRRAGDNQPYIDADAVAGRFIEFLGSINHPRDITYAALAEHAGGAIFTMGFQGATWEVTTTADPLVPRRDNSGAGLDEFRKRAGFVLLPPLFSVARHAVAVCAISNAPEMAPWRIGGQRRGHGAHASIYDRPIPRRIIEEAGVDRLAFGQKKTAASLQIRASERVQNEAFDALVRRYRTAL
jgi:hypothetical protein